MRKNLDSVISILFLFFWFACLTSQSLMDLADFLLFAAGIVVLIRAAKSAKNWKMLWPRTLRLEWLWISWLVVVAIGLLTNDGVNKNTLEAFFEFRWILSFHIMCFTLSMIEWNNKKVSAIYLILLVMVGVSFYLYTQAEDPRAGGPFGHSMPFAHTYGVAFLFAAGILLIGLKNNATWKWLGLVTTLGAATISSMSMTRGAWVGMFAGTVCISLFRSRRYGLIMTTCLITIFAAVLALSPVARERTFSTNNTSNESDNQRKALWQANIAIAKDYPVFGTGYSQNKNHLRAYYDKLGYPADQFVSHAHNQYLHLWAGTGTLGLLCYLMFLFATMRYTILAFIKLDVYKQWLQRSLALGSLGGQVCFVVASLTESNFSIAKNRFIFLLVSAVGVSIYYRYIAKDDFEKYQKALLGSPKI